MNADALCQAFRLSRSALYRLFEPLVGGAAYIQERRLGRAYADLADLGSERAYRGWLRSLRRT